jgi:transketolase C-terminal domain/subunit
LLQVLFSKIVIFLAGGIGEAVAGAVAGETGISVKRLAVLTIPRSGEGMQLMANFGIDSEAIVKAVTDMLH